MAQTRLLKPVKIAGVVTLCQLAAGVTPGAVDHPPPLDRRPGVNRLCPALDVLTGPHIQKLRCLILSPRRGSNAFDASGDNVVLSSLAGWYRCFRRQGRCGTVGTRPMSAAWQSGFLLADGHGGIAHGDVADVTRLARAPCA